MFALIRLLLRIIPQFLLLTFVSVSVVYTTNLLVFAPLSSLVSALLDFLASHLSAGGHSRFQTAHSGHTNNGRYDLMPAATSSHTTSVAAGILDSDLKGSKLLENLRNVHSPDTGASMFTWTSSDFVLKHGLGHTMPISVDERQLLSKVFATSMRPSDIVPYFYRATGHFKRDDITITTLITSNRFEVFARLVEQYRGPISVTVHIKDTPEHMREVLVALDAMYTASASMARFVDVHLVVDAFDRQFNTWRNIARLFARTDFVMMLDIDFFPASDFRSVVRQVAAGSAAIAEALYAGRAALVVPAFEYVDFHEGTNYKTFPRSKTELLELVSQQRIGMFHASWGPGHNASDYKRFYAAPPGEVYKVTRYQASYEPYVIFKKIGPPWCDERFVGYGGNKAACLFEMYIAGLSYHVLADHFIIHQNHLYEETARKNERKMNRKIYADFKEETCLRYLKRYQDAKTLDSKLAENAVTECKKIKSLARMVPKYFQNGA